ncbi:unnamed protein product [Rotaria sordida]|uniref:phosphatidylinositol-3,5-bisphosphate 3-phosphatase n=1 Tax=Rotaria sordida TaxID=392033 RepID=A0A815JKL5_9BILA|nr:unnamed protein product [Rotaria sordida]CAF1378866.1 unnamed protein product [Rotaria sordida]CAF3889128.1 unnamed protein product [Rotaria sordida]CAF3921046.1 unnamed protein product [Rotaria sordida]
MVIEVPSPVTIVDEDMHVCEVPIFNNQIPNNSIPTSFCSTSPTLESLPMISTELPINKSRKCLINIDDLPFDFLNGEEYIDHSNDLTDGIIYLTTYRVFIFTNDLCCSFINYPIRLIDLIEMKDNIYLYIQCKDMRSFRLTFLTTDKCSYWLRKLTELISIPICLDDLFAIKFFLTKLNQERSFKNRFRDEFIRLQLDTYPWRLTELNRNYELCTSYPEFCVVPSSITDEEISEVAKFRSYRRFPTIVWRHSNGAVIARTSQPEVGWLFWRSKEDEKMIQAIINACHPTATDSLPREAGSNRLLILDARSYTAAIANRAKGGGFEYPPYYTDCDVQFMNLPNIHAIRKSAQMLRVAIANAAQGENWLSQLESTRWLHNLSALIGAASFVVSNINKHGRPVLVHCSDGWDRTPQITALAEIMLDSYYRTIEGFQILVQREWIAFGHKFADRCGHGVGANDPNERSPVFLQWLDCIYQLFIQYPIAFEFNEMFLLKLAMHTYTCLYGTFLCNTDYERTIAKLETRTLNVWSLLNIKSTQFNNHLFDETNKEVLYPSYAIRDLRIWSNLYLRDVRHTPAGTSEHPSTTTTSVVPGRLHSYEDLSSLTNGLHRSTSDPSLTGSLSLESSSITIRTANIDTNNNSLINGSQQIQTNRLQNSTSTNSLFGPPHHLGTYNDNNHNMTNNSIHILSNPGSPHNINIPSSPRSIIPISNNNNCHDSPDKGIKQQSYTTDDSAPDITQLALSFQRYPLNINSVDNILRAMSRPRKHTNSTSSTHSNLSECSLTKINTNDSNETQQIISSQASPSSSSNKRIKSVRKRIDNDGLTKIPDQITKRMFEKRREYVEEIECLNDQIGRMLKFIHTLIKLNNNNNNNNLHNTSPHMDAISQSNKNSIETSSCASWQKIDNTEGAVTRWMPDFNVHTCHSCHTKFQQWPISRKHHCRNCGNVFCNSCANYYKTIPSLNLTRPVRVCRDCFPVIDDDNNNNNHHTSVESSTKSAAPIPIQISCRQPNGTSNGSFNASGGQKIKG